MRQVQLESYCRLLQRTSLTLQTKIFTADVYFAATTCTICGCKSSGLEGWGGGSSVVSKTTSHSVNDRYLQSNVVKELALCL